MFHSGRHFHRIQLPLMFPEGDGSGGPDQSSEFKADMDLLNGDVDGLGDEDNPDEEEEVDPETGRRAPKSKTPKAEGPDVEDKDEEDEDDPDDEEEEEEGDDDPDDEDDEDEEDEEEGEGDKDKKAKLAPIIGRPTVKDIKERVPDLFKTLPGLRPIYFEHEAYKKVFASPEVAEEGARKAGEYDFLEETLVQNGDPEPLFETLANNNPKAFKTMIMKIPDALEKVDRATFLEFTEPILERFVASMASHAKKTGDQNLMKVARHAANFAFANGGAIPDPQARRNGNGTHPAEVQLQKEREQHAQREHSRAAGEMNGRVRSMIQAIALEGVPKEASEFIKRGLVRDLTSEIDSTLGKDAAFGQQMQGLWRKAKTSGYSGESTEGIYNAWSSRAKPILRDIARRLRSEALGARKVKPREDEDTKDREKDKPRKKHFKSSQRSSSKSDRREVLDPSKIDYRRTSDLDILNGNVKLKGQR